jgi:hypothetical protein
VEKQCRRIVSESQRRRVFSAIMSDIIFYAIAGLGALIFAVFLLVLLSSASRGDY